MAPRGSRADHYRSIAGFYGLRLIDDILNPHVPEFVIQSDARRVAHYGLMAIKLAEKPRRAAVAAWMPRVLATSDSIPA